MANLKQINTIEYLGQRLWLGSVQTVRTGESVGGWVKGEVGEQCPDLSDLPAEDVELGEVGLCLWPWPDSCWGGGRAMVTAWTYHERGQLTPAHPHGLYPQGLWAVRGTWILTGSFQSLCAYPLKRLFTLERFHASPLILQVEEKGEGRASCFQIILSTCTGQPIK